MNKEAFFARRQPRHLVTLDGGQDIGIRKLTAAEVETIRKNYASEANAMAGFRYIVSRCVIDEVGNRVFDDADAAKLAEVDFDTIQTIASKVMEISGLVKQDPKKE